MTAPTLLGGEQSCFQGTVLAHAQEQVSCLEDAGRPFRKEAEMAELFASQAAEGDRARAPRQHERRIYDP